MAWFIGLLRGQHRIRIQCFHFAQGDGFLVAFRAYLAVPGNLSVRIGKRRTLAEPGRRSHVACQTSPAHFTGDRRPHQRLCGGGGGVFAFRCKWRIINQAN